MRRTEVNLFCSMSEEVSKRSIAEARRQRLLARGKDRLQQITQGQPQKDVADHGAEVPHLELGREGQNIDAATPLTQTQTSLCSVDRSLTGSHSLPQEATQPLEPDETEPFFVQHDAETAARPESDRPMSPPPNTLWNTPRASNRNRSSDDAAQTFTASAEEQKMATWAKYNEQAAELISKADKNKAKQRQISWHQATAAAVQTTHLLRLSAAVLLIMTLRAAKSVVYGGTDIAGWQRALTHVYAVPPLVLLTLLQLSAIFLFARMYHDTPSTVPSKVCSHCSHMVVVQVHHRCSWIIVPGKASLKECCDVHLMSSKAQLQVSVLAVVSRADVSTTWL
ncbi:TPA: hypothetical protein ACH3X1_008317 [Trebouxia sp. C0004]